MNQVKAQVKNASKKAQQVQDSMTDSMKFGDKTELGYAIADMHGRQVIEGYTERWQQIAPEIAEFLSGGSALVLRNDYKKSLPPARSFIETLFADSDLEVMEIDDGKI